MRVADPADNGELVRVMRAAMVTPGPVYFRVSKLAVPDVLDADEVVRVGTGSRLAPRA